MYDHVINVIPYMTFYGIITPMITLIADYISGLSSLSYDYFNSLLHFGVTITLLWLL